MFNKLSSDFIVGENLGPIRLSNIYNTTPVANIVPISNARRCDFYWYFI